MTIRKIVSRSIGTDVIAAEDLAANSVTVAEIQDGAVTEAKIGSGAVTGAKIGDGEITGAKIGDTEVSAGKLASTLDLSSNTVTLPDESVTADKLDVGQIGGRRNLIINGAMQVAQRGTSAVTANGTFPVDRFRTDFSTDGGFSMEQSTEAPAGLKYSIKWTVTTADASLAATQYAYFRQIIEGYNVSHLDWGTSNAKTVTLSFYIRSSVTGTFGGAVWNGDFNRSYPFTYTVDSADTWEKKTITIQGDTSGTWDTTTGRGLNVSIHAASGSTYSGTAGSWGASGYVTATGATNIMATLNATYYVTGVQLEVGTVATPFEHRSYGEELALCQRYYQVIADGSYGGTSAFGAAFYYESDKVRSPQNLPVVMRATPTLVASNGTDHYAIARAGAIDYVSALDLTFSHPNFVLINESTNASGTGGVAGYIRLDDANAFVHLDAEL